MDRAHPEGVETILSKHSIQHGSAQPRIQTSTRAIAIEQQLSHAIERIQKV
jgi:hypothetical protein